MYQYNATMTILYEEGYQSATNGVWVQLRQWSTGNGKDPNDVVLESRVFVDGEIVAEYIKRLNKVPFGEESQLIRRAIRHYDELIESHPDHLANI